MVALPHLTQTGGVLINVGSEASEVVVPLQGMYSASKHAVKGYTDGLRLEMEADGNPIRIVLIQPTVVDTPFPEHAANYLDSEPKLPTPMIEPEKVAAAILEAAVNPKDAVKVGLVAKLDTTMNKLLPALTEEIMKMQLGRQQRDERSHSRDGNLYEPGGDGRSGVAATKTQAPRAKPENPTSAPRKVTRLSAARRSPRPPCRRSAEGRRLRAQRGRSMHQPWPHPTHNGPYGGIRTIGLGPMSWPDGHPV